MSRSYKKHPFANRGRGRHELKRDAETDVRNRLKGTYECLDGGTYKKVNLNYIDLNEFGHHPAPTWTAYLQEELRENPNANPKELRRAYIKKYLGK